MAVTPELLRDAGERVGTTMLLAGVSQALISIQGWDEWWVIPLVALLNTVKVALAARTGDPNTGGFVDVTAAEEADDGGSFLDLEDTGNDVEDGVVQDVDQDPSVDYGD